MSVTCELWCIILTVSLKRQVARVQERRHIQMAKLKQSRYGGRWHHPSCTRLSYCYSFCHKPFGSITGFQSSWWQQQKMGTQLRVIRWGPASTQHHFFMFWIWGLRNILWYGRSIAPDRPNKLRLSNCSRRLATYGFKFSIKTGKS